MTKTRTRTRTKSRKGGQIVNYYPDSPWHLRGFAPLDNHSSDCGANVFYMLGYCNWHDANYLADLTQDGLACENVISMLDDAYDTNHWFEQINDLSEVREHLVMSDRATLGLLTRTEDMGHFFVVYTGHTQEGTYNLAFDPQTNERTNLDQYLVEQEADDFFILNSDSVVMGNNRVTRAIIDQYIYEDNRDN